MSVVLWAAIGYAFGSIPAAFLAARAAGRADVARDADRSVGEADMHVLLREAGAGRAAAAAGVLDVVKAFVPALVCGLVVGPYEAAACGIGAVAGHCWPPVLRQFAGRGLAAAAGAFLALVPVEMVLGGIVTAAGIPAKVGGLASTIGFVSIPVVAGLRGQPSPYQVMAWAIVALVVARRLEGVSEDVAAGIPPGRAVARRALMDVSRRGPAADDPVAAD